MSTDFSQTPTVQARQVASDVSSAQRGAQTPVLALLGTRRTTGGLSLLILLALTIGTSVAPMLGDSTRGLARGESEGTRISARLLAQPIVRYEQRRAMRQREEPAQERAVSDWPGSVRTKPHLAMVDTSPCGWVGLCVREALLALPPPGSLCAA